VDAGAPAAEVLGRLVERLAELPLPPGLEAQLRELSDLLRRSPEDRARIVAWALAGAPPDPAPAAHPGLARFLAWTALRRVLAPVIAAFGAARCEDRWSRGTCPTCGAPPAMSRLVADDAFRHRHLACGCCGTRWRYKRIGCPFCGNEAPERLDVLEVTGEDGFRLDACRECKGYTKTWAGEGDGALFLADWPTLHLDVLAREQGLSRLGASLYEL
jgi:FdhE protein